MSKKVLTMILTLALLLSMSVFTGCGGGDAEGSVPEKVVIGTQNLMNAEAIAKAEGYYEEAMGDVDVEIKVFNAGRDINTAMAAGEIDFGVLGGAPVAVGLSSGVEYQVIWSTALLTNSEAMVAKPDSGIETVKDLEGKKIATTFTSTTHFSLLSVLKVEGVDLSKVTILDMEPDKIVAAWMRGDIDAAYTWNPALAEMVSDGGNVIVTSGEVGDMGYPVADFAVESNAFAEAYPDYVVKYLQALDKATTLLHEDQDTAYGIIAEAFESTPEDISTQMTDTYLTGEELMGADYMGGGFADSLYKVAQFLFEQEQIPELPELALFQNAVNGSFLEDAMAE